MTELNKKFKFKKSVRHCTTDNQKITFFENNLEAFFSNSKTGTNSANEILSNEIDDAFYVYANMKKMSEKELEDLKKLSWKDYPRNFKVFLFDFCILNAD